MSKKVFGAAEEALGKGSIRYLLVDRGFVDGAWITELHTRGTRVTIGVKEDMLVMEEMKNLSRLPDAEWTPAEPPKIHDDPVLERAVRASHGGPYTDKPALHSQASSPPSSKKAERSATV